ncbi:MAG TPA: hypothetical protein VNF68_11865 [Candidatus Baltobacteraceae bacterium]|nr:hypothetical protein [Candidatus Baltobacteraceae bacterium]
MPRTCCLAGVTAKDVPLLTAALNAAVAGAETIVARLDVALLNTLALDVLVVDLDALAVDPLEVLRQVRFVVPGCAIVVYTNSTEASFARDCHNAGANCLLSKSSTEKQLASGLRYAMHSGCFTDPNFASSA